MRDDDYVEVVDDEDVVEYGTGVTAQLVDTIGAVLIAVLSLRFLLSLFGANPANSFANFIFSITDPLVRPFVGIFSFGPRLGDARIEFETIIAIVIYGVLTMVLARLVSLPRHHKNVY
jgi:uncharacterized protein YggT (Ycf19 family)